jgi:hypothetical protein
MHSSSLAGQALSLPVRVALKTLTLTLAVAGVLVVSLSPMFVH